MKTSLWVGFAAIVLVIALIVVLPGNESQKNERFNADSSLRDTEQIAQPNTAPNSGPTVISSGNISNSQAREIRISAKKFEFTPSSIKVKEGERIKIIIDNTDGNHGINIPDFQARGLDSLEFTASKKGTFTFYCTTYCGSGHRDMTGTLIVE